RQTVDFRAQQAMGIGSGGPSFEITARELAAGAERVDHSLLHQFKLLELLVDVPGNHQRYFFKLASVIVQSMVAKLKDHAARHDNDRHDEQSSTGQQPAD